MGEKKKTLFEINVENFEFNPSPRISGDLGRKLEEYEQAGSKLGLFGSNEEATKELDEEDTESSGGLFSRESGEEDENEETTGAVEETEVEVEAPEEESEDSGSGLGLVIGLLFLLVVAAVAKKVIVEDDVEEYEEVELSEYEN